MVSRGLLSGKSARGEDGEGHMCGVTTGVKLNHSGPYVGYGKRRKKERKNSSRDNLSSTGPCCRIVSQC